MREFNREFGYKTRKHPFACCLSDIRRWIPSDNRKDCRPLPHSIVSAPDDQSLSAENESCALHIEQLLNTGSPTDVQQSRPQPSHVILDTLLGDSQEDATSHDVIIKSDGNEQQNARHSPLAADDQRESPIHTCPPLFGHLARFDDASSVNIGKEEEADATSPLPAAQPEIDKTGSRCDNTRHNIGKQSHVVVHPTWLPTFQSEYSHADKDQGARLSFRPGCLRANGSLAIVRRGHDKDAVHAAENSPLPPGVERPQQSVIAKPDLELYIGLNESADLFPSQADDWNLQNTSSRNTSTCTIFPDSTPSLLLFPSSEDMDSFDVVCSSRQTASPTCMASGDLNRGPTTIWTGDNSVEETPESAYTGNDLINNKQVPTKRSINKEKFPSVINTLSRC